LDEGYVVEFSRLDGTTIAWLYVESADVEPAPDIIVPSGHLTA